MTSFTIDCAYCVGPVTLFHVSRPAGADDLSWRAAWKAHASVAAYTIMCPGCGGRFRAVDDGIDPAVGGSIARMDISSPKIFSVNVATGPRTGGNAVFITGESLEIGTLTVRVGGKTVNTVDQRTPTTARIVMPTATYQLNVEEICRRLTMTPTSGTLSLDEAITTPLGSTATIRLISSNQYVVAFANQVESLASMVGVTVTGTGGGTAIVTATYAPSMQAGETLSGSTSGASAVIRSVDPMVVDTPTAGFAPYELVYAPTSDAYIRLGGSPAYSGLVDIEVENEHGQRSTNNSLVGAYSYA